MGRSQLRVGEGEATTDDALADWVGVEGLSDTAGESERAEPFLRTRI
jgi:hypothetical protein